MAREVWMNGRRWVPAKLTFVVCLSVANSSSQTFTSLLLLLLLFESGFSLLIGFSQFHWPQKKKPRQNEVLVLTTKRRKGISYFIT
jgi:hypothetical protein